MQAVWVALIVAIAGLASPMPLAHLTNKQRQQERLEDYRRQDEVADKAARANAKVVQTTTVTNTKLDEIHELVNSNMTKVMHSELDAVTRELIMMREVMSLNQAAGRQPTTETLAAIAATQTKVNELTVALQSRLGLSQQTSTPEARTLGG